MLQADLQPTQQDKKNMIQVDLQPLILLRGNTFRNKALYNAQLGWQQSKQNPAVSSMVG